MRLEYESVSVEYDIRGNGSPVLLLHGWGGSSQSFLPLIDQLAVTHMVITPDFPGHGKSDEPPVPWGVNEFCECIVKLIEQTGIAPCDIVSHSFGGRVAIMLAAKYPKLVNKIVFCDSAGVKPKRSLKYHFKVVIFKIAKWLAKNRMLREAFRLDEKMKSSGSSDYKALSPMMKPTFVKIVNQDLTPLLKQVRAPSLLIWGSQDKDTPLYMARIMEKEIEDSALIVFEGAGHFAYLDDFARFCAIVSSFFGG